MSSPEPEGWLASRHGLPGDASVTVPVNMDGLGDVWIGQEAQFGYMLAPICGDGAIRLQARYRESSIAIGARCEFSNNVTIIALDRVSIGNDCLIASDVLIFDSDFHDVDPSLRLDRKIRAESDGATACVNIGDSVWLGSRSLILKGTSIGHGSVVAAGAVVGGCFPDRSLIAGVPGRFIRTL